MIDTPPLTAIGVPDTLDALAATIATRRNTKAFAAQPVPRPLLGRLLDLAVWAPNHRLTEPWRFYVFDGAALEQLGTVAALVTQRQFERAVGVDPAVTARKAAEAAASWAMLPAVVYVTVQTDSDPEIDLENYGAACCAVQTLLLAAQSAGLVSSWSSGAVALADELRHLAGATATERVVGLIRLGYPALDEPAKVGKRTPAATRTVWVADI